jgi:hypothetical protein
LPKKAPEKWDLAVYHKDYYDYDTLFYPGDILPPEKCQMMFFTCYDENSLEILKTINYTRLAYQSLSMPCFYKSDLLLEYERLKCLPKVPE